MAQAGFFVPAQSAKIGIIDALFSRVGSSDNLAGNQSTFMVEMSETANILKHATKQSLVIMDEIGRGTSSLDGVSLACAILKRLVTQNKSMTLFSTHYHEIQALLRHAVEGDDSGGGGSVDSVKFMRTKTHCEDGGFAFLYQLEEGLSDQSHGIQIAKLAGK